jgi:hypothetical protein
MFRDNLQRELNLRQIGHQELRAQRRTVERQVAEGGEFGAGHVDGEVGLERAAGRVEDGDEEGDQDLQGVFEEGGEGEGVGVGCSCAVC